MDGVLERIKASLYKTSDGEIIDVAVLEPEEMDYIFSVIEFREEDIKKLQEEVKQWSIVAHANREEIDRHLKPKIKELENVNTVIKEYNYMYLKEISSLKKSIENLKVQNEKVHEQANLLREYREENEDLKRRLAAQKSILSGLKKKNDHYQSALSYFAECGSERAKDVLEDFEL